MPVSNHQGVTWITGRQVDSSELAMLDRWEKYHALDPTFPSTGWCEAIDLHCLLYVILHDEEVGPAMLADVSASSGTVVVRHEEEKWIRASQ